MVSGFPMQAYYRPNALTVDTAQAQKFFDEEDSSILDESILDHSAIDSGLEMSPPMIDSRRDSFAVSASLFSPKNEDWQSVDMQSVPSNNPFLEPQSNNPFTRPDQSQSTYAPHNQQWSMSQNPGTCTPMQYDGLETTYDGNASIFQRPLPVQTPFSNPGGQVPLFSAVGHNASSMPTSPQKDWMSQNQSVAKRMQPGSPAIRSHNDLRRGDGIRKKNARFDIPINHNLQNIDHLIAQSNDETEIKELKQQKRLLRNRQAALDSRQRKKLHTERLEDEKKHYTVLISSLEDDVGDLQLKMAQLMRDKEYLQNMIENERMEKEELIQANTIETGELRKKVSVLTEHVQRLENASLGNAGFSHGFNDMEGLMDAPWDNMGFMGTEYPMEPEVKHETDLIHSTKKAEIQLPADVDKSTTQGGLLLMLFLVGAFVLSKGSVPTIPRVSEDVREVSATILDNIFKDAGVTHAPEGHMTSAAAPQPSGHANWATSDPITNNGMDGVTPSMLSDMADSLTQPTQEQMNEQLFSLTPAQYNGISSQDFARPPATRSTSQGRRNLAEALSNIRNSGKQSAAEVYTRSLLWDQIPSDVVRNFAKMVAECNDDAGGGRQAQPHGNDVHA